MAPSGSSKTAGGAAKGGASKAAPVNSNIPKAPPVSHFMAYIAGNYDPANPPSDTGAGAPPRQSEDIEFNPDEIKN